MKRAWLIGGRVRIKSQLRQFVICVRAAARHMNQLMAPLPASRVIASRPFSRYGVDYAGPFQVLRSKGRGARSTKGYVAVFICHSTKAIHHELIGDLTTATFLGALHRLAGRRSRPDEIWSDNATNFRGADLELRRQFAAAELAWDASTSTLVSEGTKWQLIPASSPHFGGLWEAGVKSMKNHLQRVAGPRRLTYQEFSTVLVEIKAVLYSHPLSPLSDGSDDLDPLMPAHFLMGFFSASFPQPSSQIVVIDRLSH